MFSRKPLDKKTLEMTNFQQTIEDNELLELIILMENLSDYDLDKVVGAAEVLLKERHFNRG